MSEILNNWVTSVHGDALNLPKVIVPLQDFDTVTIKHLSYVGLVAVESIFMVWCTYTKSYVASFTIDTNEFKCDQSLDTVIRLNKSNFNMCFKLHYYDPNDAILKPSIDAAFMSITLEFIKYKNS